MCLLPSSTYLPKQMSAFASEIGSLDPGVLDDEEVVLALQFGMDPDIEARHHGQVALHSLISLLVLVQVLWLHPKEVVSVPCLKAVEKHSIEILVELRSCVLHQHLHLIDQLRLYVALFALGSSV